MPIAPNSTRASTSSIPRPAADPERPGRQHPAVAFAVAAVLLIAWALRLFVYSPAELGLDGHLSVGLALASLDEMLAFLARDVHPPLYYLSLRPWLAVAGVNVVAARWLSLAAGLLTLALLFRLVRSFAGPRGTLAALALLALAPAHITISATARDFAPGFLLSVATLLVWRQFDRSLTPRHQRRLLLSFAFLTALALATWYFHLLFMAVQFVDLAARRPIHRGRLITLAIGIATQVPWLVLAGPPLVEKAINGVTVSGSPAAPAPMSALVGGLAEVLVGIVPLPASSIGLGFAWLILVGIGLVRGWRLGGDIRRRTTMAAIGLGLGLVVIYFLTSAWALPTLLGRYAVIMLPWAAILQAIALEHAVSSTRTNGHLMKGAALAGYSMIVVGSGIAFKAALELPAIPYRSWTAVATPIERAAPGDAIVFEDYARLGLYALLAPEPLPAISIHVAGSSFLRDDVAASSRQRLEPLLASHARVWLVETVPNDREIRQQVETTLLADRYLIETWSDDAEATTVKLYGHGPMLEHHTEKASFGGQIMLASWAATPATAPGGNIYIELEWRAQQPPDADYTVFVHLVDAADDGRKVAQSDSAPAAGTRPTSSWQPGESILDRRVLLVPAETPPSTYRLLVGLYRGTSRLPVGGGDHLVLGEIQVVR